MLNGEISKVHLDNMYSFIWNKINTMLKIYGFPIECHHVSWKDGGFSIPSLRDRSNVLSICSFAHMIFSRDPNIQNITNAIIEHERKYIQIPLEIEISAHFLN
jgi:hypothetical protein